MININYSSNINIEELKREWTNLQNNMKRSLNSKEWNLIKTPINLKDIKLVAGVDISFDKNDSDIGCAYITIMEYDTLKTTYSIIYEDHEIIKMRHPYISGFLGFREVPYYLRLLNKVPPKFKPDVIMVDGYGILHPREFGSATYLGYVCGIPTIGIAKKLLVVDGMDKKNLTDDLKKTWSIDNPYNLIIGKSNKTYGAIYSRNNGNPIFISVGVGIELTDAIILTQHYCQQYRIPEPIRNSDIKSKKYFS